MGGNQRIAFGVACGGTGGHVFPGLAVASVMVARGHGMTVYLGSREVESRSVAGWDGRVVRVPAERPGPGMLLRLPRVVAGVLRTARDLRKDGVRALLAMGSYASLVPVVAARLVGVPCVIHEGNARPGRAVRLLSRFAAAVCTSFPDPDGVIRHRCVVHTGFPLRPALLAGLRANTRGMENRPFVVLVMGGSQGARRLNEVTVAAFRAWRAAGAVPFRVIHLAGPAEAESVRAAYAATGVEARVHDFLSDMAGVYNEADVAVCRSGAASCMELSAAGIPAVLVPYPFAANDHQTANAEAMVRTGGAILLPQAELAPERLCATLDGLARDPAGLDRMRAGVRKLCALDAAERVAAVMEDVAGLTGGR